MVGIGHLGSQYARIYAELPNVELIGLCDPVNKEEIARKYKTVWYADYHQILGKVDAVSIVVPTNRHYGVAKDFLKKDIPVLLEKPMTETINQAGELIRIAKNKKTTLQIGHIERFNPAIKKLKQLLKEPRFVEIHRLGPYPGRGTEVSVVLDLMIHDLDIVFNIVESPLKQISAVGVPVVSAREDIANVRLTFQNRAVANLTASRITDKSLRKIRVFEPNRYFSLDYSKQELICYEKKSMGRIHPTRGLDESSPYNKQSKLCNYNRKFPGDLIKRRVIKIKKEEPLRNEILSFLECLKKKKSPLISGEEGKNALRIALKIEEEMEK